MKPTRISHWIALCACILTVHGVTAGNPNVVVILSDDQGWGDLSHNGNTNLSTPNIDSLADQGAVLNQFFVCQVCAPTRAEFLTGRYHPRTGVSGVSTGQERLNPDETTIADIFKRAGYATGAFGKWHNGTQPPYHPNYRGFDEYYGFTSGHWGHYFSPPLDHNGRTVRGNGFVVDDFTDHAIRFIEQNRDRPFFCYIPYNTPHSPMMVADEFYGKFAEKRLEMFHRDAEREDLSWTRAALAMCENIDWNVGRVLAKLEQLGLAENTIVIYFSDNGPNSYRWNGGFKGRKGAIDEGGVRSPFLIRWPAAIPAGSRFDDIAGAIDLLPTLAGMAGIKAGLDKPLDGINLSGLLTGKIENLPDRTLFSVKLERGEPVVSARTLRFRLDQDEGLFDMSSDPGQHTDVAARFPEIAARLRAEARLHKGVMASLFKQYAERPFTVGFDKSTTLPARDGVPHGSIQRSVSSPNNSFFRNWTRTDDSITWDIEVVQAGNYRASVQYTCASGNEGAMVRLSIAGGNPALATVTDIWDPPLYDKSMERVAESHYFMKDFKPLGMGTISLPKGPAVLRLDAVKMTGPQVIDVYAVQLERVD